MPIMKKDTVKITQIHVIPGEDLDTAYGLGSDGQVYVWGKDGCWFLFVRPRR